MAVHDAPSFLFVRRRGHQGDGEQHQGGRADGGLAEDGDAVMSPYCAAPLAELQMPVHITTTNDDEHRESAEAVGGGMLALVLLLGDEQWWQGVAIHHLHRTSAEPGPKPKAKKKQLGHDRDDSAGLVMGIGLQRVGQVHGVARGSVLTATA